MNPRRTFTFDGFGINGPDEYRSRLATFTAAGLDYPGLGPLLESAPDVLKALESLTAAVNTEGLPDPFIMFACIEKARAAIALARGEK